MVGLSRHLRDQTFKSMHARKDVMALKFQATHLLYLMPVLSNPEMSARFALGSETLLLVYRV